MPAPAPTGRRYGRSRRRQRSTLRRRLWRAVQAGLEIARETQWLVPTAAIALGVLMALVAGTFGQNPDPESWTISVARARDSLMSLLSLVFAGMSIVLAVGSVTTQNVVSRFSLRMLRIYQRELRDKAVIGSFALAASFIMIEQIRLRDQEPTDLAPIPGVTISLVLIFLSGVSTIWYLSALSAWFRVDRTTRRVAKTALRNARALERRYTDFDPAPRSLLERPETFAPVLAPRSGHLSGLDFDKLYERAVNDDITIVFTQLDGTAVLRGEPIGWTSSRHSRPTNAIPVPDVGEAVDITPSLTLEGAVDYRIVVLVDIAIMALSPAVNDPNTAVQVVDEMVFLFAELAAVELGPAVLRDEAGEARIVVDAMTFGDYLDLATEQIALYGLSDPAVRRSLERLVQVLSALDLSDEGRLAVERLRCRMTGQVSPDGS